MLDVSLIGCKKLPLTGYTLGFTARMAVAAEGASYGSGFVRFVAAGTFSEATEERKALFTCRGASRFPSRQTRMDIETALLLCGGI